MKKSIMASKGTPQQFAAALQNKIAELGGGVEDINSSTSITASEGEDSQYIQELAQKAAQQASEDSGWSVTHNIAGGMISFVVSDGTQQLGTYIQPIGEIYPDWAELDDDVQQLASEILNQIEPNMNGGIDPEVGSPTL